jgi:hypothetical protein
VDSAGAVTVHAMPPKAMCELSSSDVTAQCCQTGGRHDLETPVGWRISAPFSVVSTTLGEHTWARRDDPLPQRRHAVGA